MMRDGGVGLKGCGERRGMESGGELRVCRP